MILQRKRGFRTVMLLLQCVLIALTFLVCTGVATFFISITFQQLTYYPTYLAVMMLGLGIEANRRNLSSKQFNPFGRNFFQQHQISLNQTLYAAGALFTYVVVTKDNFISRTSLALYIPILYLALLWSNRYLSPILAQSLFRGLRRSRALLIGSIPKAQSLRSWLQNKEGYGMETVGILNNDSAEAGTFGDLRHLGPVSDLEKIIKQHDITQVVLLQIPETSDQYKTLLDVTESLGVRLLIFNNLEEKLNHPVIYIEDDGFHFLSLREEPLENPLNRIAKRLLDLSIALPVVVFILPPVAFFVWIIQRINSPGRLFYQQLRAGIQNHQFLIWKFRTMHEDNPDAARQATRNDARIFPGGQFLRRFSLDELPQFWNVVLGDMSITGPRPHLIEHNEQFARQIAHYPIRTVVKPGITGLAQVRGFRGEALTANDIAQRLESDISYLENWRLSLDLIIILRTIWQMFLPPKTAY